MTCIIAYKENGNIWMGCDSVGANDYSYTIRKSKKIFIRDNMIFGFTSSFRMGNLLQYKLAIPPKIPHIPIDEYMHTHFIDSVIKCFDDNGFSKIKNNEKIGGIFIVGYENRIFYIDNDYQIAESLENYAACGSGEVAALSAMHALSESSIKNPEEMIKIALSAVESVIISIREPFHILKLECNEIEESK